MDEAFAEHYAEGVERDRLLEGGDQLELVRTIEVLNDVLPTPPARVLDVGGGPGVYAARLARAGYQVHLIDVVPLHVTQARERATEQPDACFEAAVGDARELTHIEDATADVVLLLGPLYHLTEHGERIRALAEARRVLRVGGVVVAAAISRLASLMDGTRYGYLDDPRFLEIVERDLRDGQHRNADNVDYWFTTAYFHTSDQLREETEEAGFEVNRIVGVEGPGGWLANWPDHRERILAAARLASDVPDISAHMLCIAHRVA